ncbi:MAG: Type 1 glutamine amidotransferase-like domain-containing protein [Acidimicrobiales bacterium]
MSGPLALVGGGEWRAGCDFDRDLLELSGGREVLVLPTAAAYEHPERAVEAAERWFEELGATVRSLPVLTRPDAVDEANVAPLADASFIYLSGGSPMHLRSVLKDSPVWDALVAAWQRGAVLAGSGSGAMVLCDPMVDPRGGALTLGLGLLGPLAVIPHHDTWSEDKAKRTLRIAPKGLPIAGIDARTALIRGPEDEWRVAGAGTVAVFVDGVDVGLSALP